MESLVTDLEREVAGPVLTPDSPAYPEALHIYSSLADHKPAAVVRCASPADVAAGIAVARRAGVPLTVRSGGHSAAGFTLCDGVVLDLSEIRATHVDPQARTIRTGAGITWRDYDIATQEHKLGSPGGVVSSTGVAGLTLGGGIGTLRGLHGLACDNIRSAQVVLADGTQVTASADSEPDLYWALHGGGSNFGVVTEFEMDIHPVDRIVHGLIAYPIEQAPEVVANFLAQTDSFPDEFVADVLLLQTPAAPGFSVGLNVRYAGDSATAAPTLAPLREFGEPFDMVREVGYVESQQLMDPILPWGRRHYWRTLTLRGLDEEVLSTATEALHAAPKSSAKMIIEQLRGAISRVGATDTPIGFRHAPYNILIVGEWDDPADDAAMRQWTHETQEALRPFSVGGAYVNYLQSDATEDVVAAAYGPENYKRLQAIKAKYDPENVFVCNQNITPKA
jgi:FAD/FMN-containing dehydrogenase